MSLKTLKKNGIHNYDAIMKGIKKRMKEELSESNVKLISLKDEN